MNSLPPDQRTMVTPVGDDHLREAIPGMEVCDFCAETPVEWSYPCGLVQLAMTITRDPWAACRVCHSLIEADDRDSLALRAKVMGRLPADALPLLTELHARFFAARCGDPVQV